MRKRKLRYKESIVPKGIYIRTKSHNQKISRAMTGKKLSADTKRKISENHKGIFPSKSTRKKMSISHKGRKHSEEHKRKNSESHKGEKNPNWKGDSAISYEIYPREFNDQLKAEIRERDNHTCQLCGKTKQLNGKKLDVHHIDYNKGNSAPKNLITLCHTCNNEVESDKEFWVRFFKSFIIRKGI